MWLVAAILELKSSPWILGIKEEGLASRVWRKHAREAGSSFCHRQAARKGSVCEGCIQISSLRGAKGLLSSLFLWEAVT